MKITMTFVVGEDGYPVRYGDNDKKQMTPAQRVTFEAMLFRYHHIQQDKLTEHRAKEARITEKLLDDDPQLAAEVEAKARSA